MVSWSSSARRAARARGVIALLVGLTVCASPVDAVTIQFDYRFDQAGFFGTEQSPTPARVALEWAGRAFESFGDTLAAIQPGGVNSWTARFEHPTTGEFTTLDNLSVGGDRLLVFVGAYDIPGAALGEAGPGTGTPAGGSTPPFQSAVVNRGEIGVDFAPWGGAIQFDTVANDGQPRAWHFDVRTTPSPTEYDFYTVAAHELAHLMGFGTSGVFFQQQAGGAFTGETATAMYGGPVPLLSMNHWGLSVTSPPFAEPRPQPSLGATLAPGTRRLLTPLDYAALDDIGWDVPDVLLGLPGDVSGDGIVDGADLLIWQQELGTTTPRGDATGDGAIDWLDRWVIDSFYGTTAAGQGSVRAAGAVPEPASGAITVIGLAGLCRSVRKRRSRRR